MGRGICPIIGSLLPLSNIDLPEKTIEELVFKRNIRVYDVRTRVMITSRNYKDMFVKNNTFEANTKSNNSVSKEEKIEVIKTIETPVTFTEVKESENVIDEPMTEIKAELSTEENIVENTLDDVCEDITTDENDNVVDSSTEEESSTPERPRYNNNKKKKHR